MFINKFQFLLFILIGNVLRAQWTANTKIQCGKTIYYSGRVGVTLTTNGTQYYSPSNITFSNSFWPDVPDVALGTGQIEVSSGIT